jgi:hypothetical protein
MIYSAPCNTTHKRPICRHICWKPYSLSPCKTGKTAESPNATNIDARNGLQAGVRNRCKTDTIVQAMPREDICNTSQQGKSDKGPGSTDHSPIHFLQCRSTPKAIVNTWDEASRDEEDDAEVVQLIPNLVDHRRMI